MIKFGFDQIGTPPPKALKFWVNTFIIVGGVIGGIIIITPEKLLDPELKAYILAAGGVIASGLKAFEKLTGKVIEDGQ